MGKPSESNTGSLEVSDAAHDDSMPTDLAQPAEQSTNVKYAYSDAAAKYPNFISGGTLFPIEKTLPPKSSTEPWLDPVMPPIAKLTHISAEDERRYAVSRLNDLSIFKMVRTYLSFLHDQPSHVCHEGQTKMSLELMIHSTGLPVDHEKLKLIYVEYVKRLGKDEKDVEKDLKSLHNFLASERTHRLQRNRASAKAWNSNF